MAKQKVQLSLKRSSNNLQNLCSSCHGKYRNGTSNPELNKDVEILNNYNPSLVGISLFNKKHFNNIFNYENFKAKHSNTKVAIAN